MIRSDMHLRFTGILSLTAASLVAALALGSAATAQVLYDGDAGSPPGAQGWLALGSTPGAVETFLPGPNVTNLNSTAANGIYAGYTNYGATVAPSGVPPFFTITPTTPINPAFPSLNRLTGYTLRFTMQLVSQSNTSLDRAGFSVIVLSSDQVGVEIGFRSTDIFSQSPTFTVAESNASAGVAVLTGALTTYDLSVLANTYTLTGGGGTLLTGTLKDYTAATGFAGDIYRTPNFLFLGDDTTSASASVNLADVQVIFAPEPATAALAVFGLLGVAVRCRRRK